MNPALPPTPEEVKAAQAVIDAAPKEEVAPAADEGASVSESSVAELEAKIAELQSQVPKPKTPEERIMELESALAAVTGSLSGVTPLTQGINIHSPNITLAAIEPGIRWAIRNGIMDAERFGEHVVKLFEEEGLPRIGKVV